MIVWTACGVLSLLGALAFAELSTVIPRSGAEYAYLVEAFTPLHRYIGQIPAFVCSWVYVFLLRPAEVAVIILTFAEYSIQPFSPLFGALCPESMTYVKKLLALLATCLITYINSTSVKLYVKLQNVFMLCKVAACILVVFGGIWWLSNGHVELLSNPFEGTTTSAGHIALAFYNGLWAYDGWSSSSVVTEEVKRPEVNILRSILIAVPLMTVLYVSMNLMYMSALTTIEMTSATAVAIVWAEKVLPSWMGFLIPLGVAISTFGCALSVQFGVSRLCYVASQEGHVPNFFNFVHIEKMTPAAAVGFQGLLSCVCILLGDITELIELASFLTWTFYGCAMVALIVLRRTKPDAPRPYKVPIVIPILVLCISLFLSITPIVHDPKWQYLFVLLFVLIGMVGYHFYIYERRKSHLLREYFHLFYCNSKICLLTTCSIDKYFDN